MENKLRILGIAIIVCVTVIAIYMKGVTMLRPTKRRSTLMLNDPLRAINISEIP
jgi:hypothetical protein